MAIDTRDERAAVIGFKQPVPRVFPNPDGSLASQADRQQIAGEYPGVLANPPAPGNAMMIRHHHHGV